MSRFNVTVTKGTKGTPSRTNTSPTSSASGPQIAAGPPLPPEQLSELLATRRNASRTFQQAQAFGREQEQMLATDARRDAQDRVRKYDDFTEQTMDRFGDRGLAFQPIGAGQGLRQIRDSEAYDAASAEYDLALNLASVAEQVAAARRQREAELAQLIGQEQQWRSQLIRDQLANFEF